MNANYSVALRFHGTRWPTAGWHVIKNIQHFYICLFSSKSQTSFQRVWKFQRASVEYRRFARDFCLRNENSGEKKQDVRARARERGKRIDEKRGQVGFRRKHPSIRMPGIGRGAFLNDPFTKSLRDVAWNFRDGEFSTESTAVNKVYVSEHARYLNVISHNKHSCNILD